MIYIKYEFFILNLFSVRRFLHMTNLVVLNF